MKCTTSHWRTYEIVMISTLGTRVAGIFRWTSYSWTTRLFWQYWPQSVLVLSMWTQAHPQPPEDSPPQMCPNQLWNAPRTCCENNISHTAQAITLLWVLVGWLAWAEWAMCGAQIQLEESTSQTHIGSYTVTLLRMKFSYIIQVIKCCLTWQNRVTIWDYL